jgi:signal transduction histidine kinase
VRDRPLFEAVPELAAQVKGILDEVLATGQPCVGKEVPSLVGPEGQRRSRIFNFVYAPLCDADGGVYGVLVMALDVSDEIAARDELSRTVHTSELFAGMLGHDLRNPLAAISTGAQLILRRTGDPKLRRAVVRIVSSAERMARMIDQLLDFTRIRWANGLSLDRKSVDLEEISLRVLDEVEGGHPEAAIHVDALGEMWGSWDGDRLAQVFSNLISNAVQHGGPERPVQVQIDGRDPGAVTVTVWNQGVIPPEVLPLIFDPFRGTRQRRASSSGLGLGLFITREIVKEHGGTVSVTSTPEEGTRFVLVLPRAPVPQRLAG